MSKTVLITNASFGMYSPRPMELLREAGFEVQWIPGATRRQILENIGDKDALLVGVEPADGEIIAAGRRLKVISKHGVGIDNIDTAAAAARGILVKNAPGTNSDAVADFAFGLMLDAARSISASDRALRAGKWPRTAGESVWGATLGIIGLGAIGKGMALRAKGFHMRLLAYDVFWNEDFAREHGVQRAELDQIYRESDFITIHAALTEETRNMIGREQFERMKPNAILVNTARGGIVDESDLYDALTSGQICGAALDAFSVEPAKDIPLFSLENVVVTPHLGAFSKEAMTRMSLVSAENIVQNV